eukprot:scaffold105451_cov18-Tisochrysis_lutea.AAC.1
MGTLHESCAQHVEASEQVGSKIVGSSSAKPREFRFAKLQLIKLMVGDAVHRAMLVYRDEFDQTCDHRILVLSLQEEPRSTWTWRAPMHSSEQIEAIPAAQFCKFASYAWPAEPYLECMGDKS